tara:strand:- start:864 stop:998 length:135 start_codon:yes stop_codon:yes gene_type:complete
MDWTTIAIEYAPVTAFIGGAVGAAFGVRVLLKSVGLAKSGLSRS